MKFDWLKAIENEASERFQRAELYSWHPELSGDIDIRVDVQGRWWHEGGLIVRRSIVDIFTSILRYEDGDYYLVTPVEKWRIQVDDVPLLVVDLSRVGNELVAELATGHEFTLGERYPLRAAVGEDALYLSLGKGLEAKFNRPAYYRAAELIDEQGRLSSGRYSFKLVD